VAVGAGLVGLAIWFLPDVVAYVLLAAMVTLLARPVSRAVAQFNVKGRKLPAGACAAIALLSVYLTFSVVVALIIPAVFAQAQALAHIDLDRSVDLLRGPLDQLRELAQRYNMPIDLHSLEARGMAHLQGLLNVGSITTGIGALLGLTGGIAIGAFSITFIAFFLIRDGHLVRQAVLSIIPDMYHAPIRNSLTHAVELLRRYVMGLLAEAFIVMLLVSLGLAIMGIDGWLLLGFIAGVLNIIPYVGPLMAAALGLAVAFTSPGLATPDQLIWMLIKVGSVYGISQFIDNMILQPLIYARSVQAHPLEVFLVILIAGNLAGLSGMIVGIPVYGTLRILISEFGPVVRGNVEPEH
jgi:predicted PurR-regulated permease PerM